MVMVARNEVGKQVPPYMSFETLRTVLDNFRAQGIPGRVDRYVMRSFSGTVQTYVLNTLKFFGLIDADGVPQPELERLVEASDADRPDLIRDLLIKFYPLIIGPQTNGFNLANATPPQLHEKFQQMGVSGDTIRKCEAFFLAAAKYVDIPTSPYLRTRTSSTETKRKTSQRTTRAKSTQPAGATKEPPVQTPQAAELSRYTGNTVTKKPSLQETLVGALQQHASKFPEFNPDWPIETQAIWLNNWEKISDKLMQMLEKTQEAESEEEEE